MLNPFSKFQCRFIPAFRKLRKRYLVTQQFHRENNLFKITGKTYLLITHYSDPGLAKIHLNALKQDPYACILDLENERHREKLEWMISMDAPFVLYSSLVTDTKVIKQALDKTLKEKIQRYVETTTRWRIRREQVVRPVVEVIFGELFVTMKYGQETMRVRLSEIE